MPRLRYLVAGLLGMTGVLHIIEPFRSAENPVAIVMVIFGIAYLAIGFIIYRADRRGYYLGAIVPAVGLVGGVVQMLQNPTGWMVFLMAFDVVVVPCSIYLIRQSRAQLSIAQKN